VEFQERVDCGARGALRHRPLQDELRAGVGGGDRVVAFIGACVDVRLDRRILGDDLESLVACIAVLRRVRRDCTMTSSTFTERT
jgi:hypothetical protein